MGFCSGTLAAVLDPATAAWVNAVTIAGGTVSAARFSPVDNLIRGLKTDGLFSLLDRLWLFAAENQPSALIDIVALSQARIAGTLTFTANRGYTGVDGNVNPNYIDTMFSPIRDGVQYTQNSAHISAWSNTEITVTAAGGCIMGNTDGTTTQTNIFPRYTDGAARYRCNSATLPTQTTQATSIGHFLSNRISSAQCHGYFNGAFTSNQDAASGTEPSNNLYVCGGNGAVPGDFPHADFGYPGQVTMASIGAEFSDAQVTSFYNRLRTYMTAVGVP